VGDAVFETVRSGRAELWDWTLDTSWKELLAVFASPPPETVTVFVTVVSPFAAIPTVSAMVGAAAPAAIGLAEVQVTVWPVAVQPQLVPAALTKVRFASSVSLTVTVPELDAFPALFTVIV
jgi:hypothetical protein